MALSAEPNLRHGLLSAAYVALLHWVSGPMLCTFTMCFALGRDSGVMLHTQKTVLDQVCSFMHCSPRRRSRAAHASGQV